MEAKIATLNNGEKLRKSRPRYIAKPMAGVNHSRFTPVRISSQNKRWSHYAAKPFLPGARCGEIFVAHNARQWTFVCTFCNKNTRDIGDFICHIKARHLEVSDYFGGGSGDSYYNSDDDYYQQEETDITNYHVRSHPRKLNRVCRTPVPAIPTNQRQRGGRMPQHAGQTTMSESSFEEQCDSFTPNSTAEYLDYGNYLDVNVHSDEEAVDYDQQHESVVDPPDAIVKTELQNDNDEDVVVSRPQFNSAIGLVGVKKNADKVELKRKIAKETKQKSMSRVNQTITESVVNGEDSAPSNSRKRKRRKEETAQEVDDLIHGAKANGTSKGEEHDSDNKVFELPSNQLEPSHDMKGKRRQIRGTAYCALCNRTFQYYSLYRNHMIKHSNETPYRCELCDKGFKSKQAIRYHMNTHKRTKPYQCQLCHAAFYIESQLVAHLSTHEDGKTFPCSTCAEILTSERERELHMASHSEERPFSCDFCQKRFRMRHHLSNHLKMHRQYRCDFCKGDFTSDVHLRKPYACDKCENTPGVTKNVDTSRPTVGRNSSGNEDRSLHTFESVDVTGATTARSATNSHDNGSDSDDTDETEEDGEAEGIGLAPEVQHSNDDTDDVVGANDITDPQQLLQPAGGSYSQSFGKERLTCKFCSRSYSHISGLNFHIRKKHLS